MPADSRGSRIPKIEWLPLPKGQPTSEVMKSWGQNEHSYHPDMWDLEYATYRYLSGVTDEELQIRYRDIIRNMSSYTRSDHDTIPINSFLSSWYWFRKEHQTRLEFAFREKEPPALSYKPLNTSAAGPHDLPVSRRTDVIFRYGKWEYMRQMVEQGQVRFSPAEAYVDEGNNSARRDDELQKHSYTPGRYATVTRETGKRINVIGDIRYTVSGPNYHLVCFSCVWDLQLFEEFQADTCVAVTNPEELARRLEAAGTSMFPGWYFHHNPIEYFDPYERIRNQYIDASMSKDFRFSYQSEYRILWSQMRASPIYGFQFVNIGPAHDIMTVYDIKGNKISM